jgi:hypothetical protein
MRKTKPAPSRRRYPAYYVMNAADLISLLPLQLAQAMRMLDILDADQQSQPPDAQCCVIGDYLKQYSRAHVRGQLHLARVMLQAAHAAR